MPVLTAAFQAGQPIVRVLVGTSGPRIDVLRRAGRRISDAQESLALLDTGASHTCIDQTILRSLDLSPTGSANVVTASSGADAHQCDEYDVSLIILMNDEQMHLVSLTIPVIALPLLESGFGVLIGRDVLASGLLVYNGKGRELLLSF